MKKVAIFVDVQNIYYTTKQSYQRHFNYSAFWAQATANRIVVGAFAYAIDKGDKKQQGFQNILRHIGFEVKLKPYIQRSDGSAKGDWECRHYPGCYRIFEQIGHHYPFIG